MMIFFIQTNLKSVIYHISLRMTRISNTKFFLLYFNVVLFTGVGIQLCNDLSC